MLQITPITREQVNDRAELEFEKARKNFWGVSSGDASRDGC
jgi:hypothetical protein